MTERAKLKGNLHDVNARLFSSVGDLAIQRVQEIPDYFLDELKAEKDASDARAGEFHRVARVPVATAEKWMREGFDIYKEPAAAIVARLKKEQLDSFVTTKKRI